MTNFSLRHLSEADLELVVWRYLTFPKYVSMMIYGAIWFSKLKILIDADEGSMPVVAGSEMTDRLLNWDVIKSNPEWTAQIKNANQRNVEDGRELTVANCWFCDDKESKRMWDDYAGPEGVAVSSTIRRLGQSVYCRPDLSLLGRVQYVDLQTHNMTHYEANQAGERAFLKGKSFLHEQEIRMTTFSLRGPMCVNLDGTAMRPDQYEGIGMNNFDAAGLYVRADLPKLITKTVLAPQATDFQENLVRRISHLAGVTSPVVRSSLGQ